MAREINNYQDLQDEVIFWLNRSDLAERVPTFIYMAERKIFRKLRTPANEKTVTFDMRTTPVNPQIALSNYLTLPGDYLEAETMQSNGQPMTRVSITEIQNQSFNAGDDYRGKTIIYSRERSQMRLHPFPDGDTLIRMIYWADFSGNLILPADDNRILWIAPDLYLYGALLQATPFIKPDDNEFRLIPVWKGMYDEGMREIEEQRDEDEFSGSNTSVKSSFHDGRVRRVRT